MNRGQWSRPVEFEFALGKYFVITNTEEAARYLLYRWPCDGGRAHLAARRVCLAVLEGERKPEDARAAFVKAAEEAGMHVRR